MTFDEMMGLQQNPKARRKPRDTEHRLQSSMVKWFRLQYPQMIHNLLAIPNAGKRTARMGAYMKEEGLMPGAADMILLKSNRFYGALLIETKTKTGYQSKSQKEWEQKIINDGYKYVVVRSIEDFMREVKDYLSYE